MSETRRRARIAGLLYVLVGLLGPFVLLYVPSRIIVRGDAAGTAEHIRSLESLLRLGIAGDLTSSVLLVFLVLALYRLFRGVSQDLAIQLVIFGAVVSVPIMFVNAIFEVGALMLAKGAPFLSAFDQAQRDSLAYLFMRLHGEGINAVEIFWGLWLFPFGLLVIRSRFIPWIIGVLLLVAGVAYVLDAYTTLVAPQYETAISGGVSIMAIGELPII